MSREPRMEREHDTPTTARRPLFLNRNAVCSCVRLAILLVAAIAALLVTMLVKLISDNYTLIFIRIEIPVDACITTT